MAAALPTTSLSQYEELHSLVKAMLIAAQQDNWEFFMDLGLRYTTQADELINASIPAEAADRDRCAKLLESILKIDVEVRLLADQQLSQIRSQITQTQREHKLNQAYGLYPQPV